ncbi:MAG: hypothetical protein M1840_007520 [Geoglossum simile]|nr:MAG: hypothetical protein M1840_007520 [Geoglossum simile]
MTSGPRHESLERERSSAQPSVGSDESQNPNASSSGRKSNRKELVLDSETKVLQYQPRNTIFEDNGQLKPKYQTTDIPPFAGKVPVFLKGSVNQTPSLLKTTKIPLPARYNRLRGRNTKIYTFVSWTF